MITRKSKHLPTKYSQHNIKPEAEPEEENAGMASPWVITADGGPGHQKSQPMHLSQCTCSRPHPPTLRPRIPRDSVGDRTGGESAVDSASQTGAWPSCRGKKYDDGGARAQDKHTTHPATHDRRPTFGHGSTIDGPLHGQATALTYQHKAGTRAGVSESIFLFSCDAIGLPLMSLEENANGEAKASQKKLEAAGRGAAIATTGRLHHRQGG